jgi:hypothetical protein
MINELKILRLLVFSYRMLPSLNALPNLNAKWAFF